MVTKPTEKTCPRCKTTKPVMDWGNHAGRYDGLAVWCKQCMSEYSREYNKRPEVRKRAAEKSLARYHTFSDAEKQRIQKRRKSLAAYLKKQYGLTLDDYNKILEDQGGVCRICEKPPKPNRRLAVDHDHACCPGQLTCGSCIRGLLCTACNINLGFYENPAWRSGVDAYLSNNLTT